MMALKIMLAVSAVGFLLAVMLLYRNEWVYQNRVRLAGTPAYDRLPSYETMLYRWWVWDINKFL